MIKYTAPWSSERDSGRAPLPNLAPQSVLLYCLHNSCPFSPPLTAILPQFFTWFECFNGKISSQGTRCRKPHVEIRLGSDFMACTKSPILDLRQGSSSPSPSSPPETLIPHNSKTIFRSAMKFGMPLQYGSALGRFWAFFKIFNFRRFFADFHRFSLFFSWKTPLFSVFYQLEAIFTTTMP